MRDFEQLARFAISSAGSNVTVARMNGMDRFLLPSLEPLDWF